MRHRHHLFVGISWLALLTPLTGRAQSAECDYYVAPDGSDMASGSFDAPWASITKAQSVVNPGQTVCARGGTYYLTSGTNTCSSTTSTVNVHDITKSGTAGNLITYQAYPGETPVFDFFGVKDNCRIKGFNIGADYVHFKSFEIQGVPQNNSDNHESWGFWISGDHNILELINAHNNMGPGVFINGGSDNLVLNCDSHHNYDEHTSNGAGESADGFGCHGSGSGNVFRGCRAWWNTDDGFDFINSNGACLVEDSWAWYNGYLPDTMTAGSNGNGFKSGGYGADYTKFPSSPAVHTTRNCLAFNNRSAGFYANHHPIDCYFYNNTAYNNHPNFNMLGMSASNGADITVGIYRNNVSYGGTALSNASNPDDDQNSWTLPVDVSDADFQSVSMQGVDGPRQADGSLPVLPFMRLAAGSDLIDAGVDVDLPYADAAPDLGCFETGLEPSGAGGTDGAGGSAAGGTTTTGGNATTGAATTAGSSASGGAMGVGGRGVTSSGMTGADGTSASGGVSSATGGAAVGGSATNGGNAVGGSGVTGSTATAAGMPGAGGTSALGSSSSGEPAMSGSSTEADGGCSCRSAGSAGGGPGALGLSTLLGLCLVHRRRFTRRLVKVPLRATSN